MASSSHLAEDSSLEEWPRDKILIPHDQAHCTYTLSTLCTKHTLFSHTIESFNLPDEFKLPIAEDWFSVSLRSKEFCGWPKSNEDCLKWLDRVADQ